MSVETNLQILSAENNVEKSGKTHTAVVIPVYREKAHIFSVLSAIDSSVQTIIVVDDCCPEQTGELVQEHCTDDRVTVLFHKQNQGVGAAMRTGYNHLLKHSDAQIIVKLDGDGQMDPKIISQLIKPLKEGRADYVKANRFYSKESFSNMPRLRLIGNALFSFTNKASSGYWNIMDPTNGFTAITRSCLLQLPLDKVSNHYFFESDMLFRLGIARAKIEDFPINAIYKDETSSVSITDALWHFPVGYLRSFCKRIAYQYFLHDFNIGSLQLLSGSFLLLFGFIFGVSHWLISINTGIPATTGTVMLAALPFILGFQLLLNFLNFDLSNIPRHCITTQTQ